MTEHIRVAANQSGPVRRETLMGREHVVVPATLVRSQVLNNNLGLCFLPADEITANWAETANHSPVITDHPTKRGQPMSAKDPGVINQMGVGQLYNVRVEDGELKGDVYLDPDRAEEVDGLDTILERVESGEPVELSTGFPLREAKPTEGVHNGERYELVIRPGGFDHLAVFAEKTGACSVADGCGLGVHEDGDEDCGCGSVANVRDTPREPSFDGTESSEWSAPDLEDFVDALDLEDVEAVEDLTDAQRSTIAAHSLLGESDADTFDDLVFFPVVNPATGDLNENALRAVISGRGEQADIPQDALERAQNTARDLLESEFDMDEDEAQNVAARLWAYLKSHVDNQEETSLDERRRIVGDHLDEMFGASDRFVHIVHDGFFEDSVVYEISVQGGEDQLFRTPYQISDDGEVTLGEREEVEKITEFVPAENGEGIEARHEYLAIHTQSSGEGDMNREEMLDALQECDAVAFRRETLEAMNDEELAHVANEAGVTGEGEPEEPEPENQEEPTDEPAENGELVEAVNAIRETVESFGERLESLEEETEAARNQHAEERERLVGDIAANSDFEEDELSDKPMAELRKLHGATATKARNFVGLGGPRKSDPADEEGELSFNVRSTWGAGPGEPVDTKES